jgi:hypothetical protein
MQIGNGNIDTNKGHDNVIRPLAGGSRSEYLHTELITTQLRDNRTVKNFETYRLQWRNRVQFSTVYDPETEEKLHDRKKDKSRKMLIVK